MTNAPLRSDTPAWVMQAWLSFLVSVALMTVGILYLPVDWWIRGYLFMGTVFMLGSSFTLAKTLRDKHEHDRFVNRVRDAKTEQVLQKFEGL